MPYGPETARADEYVCPASPSPPSTLDGSAQLTANP
jgi:hypothetical protein